MLMVFGSRSFLCFTVALYGLAPANLSLAHTFSRIPTRVLSRSLVPSLRGN